MNGEQKMAQLLLYRLVVESYYGKLRVLGMDQKAAGAALVTSSKSISAFTLMDVPEVDPEYLSRLSKSYLLESGLSEPMVTGEYFSDNPDFKLFLLNVSSHGPEPGRLRQYTPNPGVIASKQTDAHYWTTEDAVEYALRGEPLVHWETGEKVWDPEAVILRVVPLPFMYTASTIDIRDPQPFELISFFGESFLREGNSDEERIRQEYSPVFELMQPSEGSGMRWRWMEDSDGWEGSTFVVDAGDMDPVEPKIREIQGKLF